MPASARSAIVDYDTTPYYHCIARCVRRAWLCGTDAYTGKNFDHRKEWLTERLRFAASIFAIDVCAYAVLANHFHVVLRVDKDRAASLSEEAVLRRYGKLFKSPVAEARKLRGRARAERVEVFRERLFDISWFMRVVNEYLARRANAEDEVTGRFWEGRFKSVALLDERAVLTCMSYVDLNPIRAGAASSLEASDFTSIKQRLEEHADQTAAVSVPLVAMTAENRRSVGRALSIRFDDYVELLEWTGRASRAKPGGRIRGAPPEILGRLHIDPDAWVGSMRRNGLKPFASIGSVAAMDAEAERRGQRWVRGKRIARALFHR